MKPHLKHTLSKWSELLTTIPDLHTRAWAASIIYWDYSTTPAWNALQSHIVGYQSARELRAETASIIAALDYIGYEGAESRCTLRQDEAREKIMAEGRERFNDRGCPRMKIVNDYSTR